MAEDDPSRSYIISTMIFVTGLVTLIQSTVGCRYVHDNYKRKKSAVKYWLHLKN